MVEIVEKTLLLQLDEINFQPENDVDLHLEIGVGLDGAGIDAQCENKRIFLLLNFYVKSSLTKLGSENVPILVVLWL